MSLRLSLNNVFLMNKTSTPSQIMFYSLERTTVQKSLSSIIPTGAYLINGSTYENVSYLEYDNATHSYQNTSLLNKLFSLTPSQNQSYTTFFYAINSRPVNTGPITIIWISWDTFLSLLTLEQTLSLNHHVSLTGSAQITFQCAEAHLQLNLATTSLQTVVTNLKNQSIQFIASIDSYLNSNFNFTATTTNPVYTFTYVQQVLTLYSAINSNTYLMYQILLIFLLFLLLLLIYLLSSYSMAEYSELQLNSLLQRVYHPMITIGCILGSQTFADVMIFFIGLIALSVNNLLNNQYFVNINTLFVLIGMFLLIKNLYMSILLIYSANTAVSSSFKSPISPVYALTISGVVLAFLIIFYQYFEQFGVDQIIIFYLGFQIIKMFVEWYLMILISYATFLFLKYVHAYVSLRYSLTYVLLLLSGSVYFIKQYKQKLLILALFITLLFINLSTMSYYTSITANYQNDTLFGKTMLTGQDPTTLVPTIQYIQNLSHETPLCLTRFSIAS